MCFTLVKEKVCKGYHGGRRAAKCWKRWETDREPTGCVENLNGFCQPDTPASSRDLYREVRYEETTARCPECQAIVDRDYKRANKRRQEEIDRDAAAYEAEKKRNADANPPEKKKCTPSGKPHKFYR